MANGSRIVLQEPESGLDIFLKEIAKYASPSYQLAQKEQERADARLRLSERQMDVNEQRYQDSLRQRKLENDLRIEESERNKLIFEDNQRTSSYNRGKRYVDESLVGMDAKELRNINVESYLVDIENPKAKQDVRNYVSSLKSAGSRTFDEIISRMDIYNTTNPENPMSEAEALDLFVNDDVYNEYLSRSYLTKGTLTDIDKARINSLVPRITALRKTNSELLTQQQSGVSVDDALADNIAQLDNLNNRLNTILKFDDDDNQGGTGANPYGNIPSTELPDFLAHDYDPKEGGAELYASDDMYSVLFSDDKDVFDSAVESMNMATRNASGQDVESVNLLTGDDADKYDPNRAGLDEDTFPAEFTEPATEPLSGLASLQAGSNQPIPNEDVIGDLFPNQTEQQGGDAVFSLKEPPPRLKDAKKGIKEFRKLIKDFNRNSKFLSEGIPDKTSERNLRKSNDKLRKKIKEMFSKIYDEKSNSFYDDRLKRIEDNRRRFPHLKNRPLKYREFFTNEEFSLLKSL